MAKPNELIRVQKLIALSGFASRRKAEIFIEAGRVKVNGKTISLGHQCLETDHITIDDQPIHFETNAKREIYILNKRLGEVCTRSDEQCRPTVFDRLPPCPQGRWIMVGRLDINTTGLLIFTNDGAYAQKLMHPKHEVERVYVAKIFGTFDDETRKKLLSGIQLEDGIGKFNAVKIIKQVNKQTTVEVMTTSGRNRIVRRLFKAVDCQVSKLHRIRFGIYEQKKTGL